MKYFHGKGRKGSYFEGWYLKHQSKKGQALALIPAFHVDSEGRASASIQVISKDRSWWLEYPEAQFKASEDSFDIRVGQCLFSRGEIKVDIESEGLFLRGQVDYGPFTALGSDIMGPFRFLGGMQCSHGVISMGHSLRGELTLNGEELDLDGGMGYIETDWGSSFPKAYLWSQCTWGWAEGGVMLAAATIPLGIFGFKGCICSVFHRGMEYRLATYRGAFIEKWTPGCIVIRQGRYRLKAELLEEQKQALRAPDQGAMGRTVHESVSARVRFAFWRDGIQIFDHIDTNAGFEQSAI